MESAYVRSSPVEEESIKSESHLGSQRSLRLDILIGLVDPRSDLGLLRERITIDLISSSDNTVNGLLLVLAKNVSPERVGSVERFGVNSSTESVAAVSRVEVRNDSSTTREERETNQEWYMTRIS